MNLIKDLIIIALLAFVIILVIPFTVFQPALFKIFDYTVTTQISSVINNLLTPSISLISIILLYITLSKHKEQ